MRFPLILAILFLLWLPAHAQAYGLPDQLVGTWSKDLPVNPESFSWTDPIELICTFSADHSYSEKWGHRSVPVCFQGTWQIQGTELVMTITNAHGTGNYQPAPGQVGKILHRQIIQLDQHLFIWITAGQTTWFRR